MGVSRTRMIDGSLSWKKSRAMYFPRRKAATVRRSTKTIIPTASRDGSGYVTEDHQIADGPVVADEKFSP